MILINAGLLLSGSTVIRITFISCEIYAKPSSGRRLSCSSNSNAQVVEKNLQEAISTRQRREKRRGRKFSQIAARQSSQVSFGRICTSGWTDSVHFCWQHTNGMSVEKASFDNKYRNCLSRGITEWCSCADEGIV